MHKHLRLKLFRTLTSTKARLKGANTGHKLLKKKADALAVRIRMILKQVTIYEHLSEYIASKLGAAI